MAAVKRALVWDSAGFGLSTAESDITCHTAIICNAARYGGDFILSPGSSPLLPGLSAVCITGTTRRSYLKSALELFRGRAAANNNLIRIRSQFFEISGKHPIQIDGDFVGYGPARITECIDFARIIV
jgi:diacylglycerol kinase family enzyme